MHGCYARRKLFLALALLLTSGLVPIAGAAELDSRIALKARSPKKPPVERPSIRADVQLILIPVTVTDQLGAPVSGLSMQAFRLFEEGAEQQIQYFNSEDAPVSLGIVFDASRSMTDKLEKSRAAVTRVCNTSMSGDEFSLIEFNSAPRILLNFTNEPGQIEKAALSIMPRNWTALFDAVYLGINQMKQARNARKVLLVLSDGGDNRSRYSEREMRAFVREADVCIYTVGIFGGGFFVPRHAGVLKQIAEETGGKFYQVAKADELSDVVSKISQTIRNQYVLGFSSSNPRTDGVYRKIEVRLNQTREAPRLQASWRTGYYAPDAP